MELKPTKNGHIYLTYIYTKNVELPGLTIHFLNGPSRSEGDNPLFEKLYVSQEARAFLENLQSARSSGEESKILPLTQLEERLESIVRARSEQALNAIRERAKQIAPLVGMEKEFKKLNSLISDLLPSQSLRQAGLATGKSNSDSYRNLKSPAGIARALGEPLDPERARLFENLYEELAGKVFPEHKDKSTSDKAYKTFAFFEGYFSNCIEGTEFTVNEAKEIITSEAPIPSRDEDSHDILGTYRIVSDRKEMSICPTSPDQFLDLMRRRHAILLQSRTSKKPGEYGSVNKTNTPTRC